jgi:hypothetical protein
LQDFVGALASGWTALLMVLAKNATVERLIIDM